VACIERFQSTVKDKPASLAVIEEPPLLPEQGRFLSKPMERVASGINECKARLERIPEGLIVCVEAEPECWRDRSQV